MVPPSSRRAMFGWSSVARICRSARNRAEQLGIVGAVPDQLDRDFLAEGVVGAHGAVDGAHAAAAELARDLVGADAPPDERALSRRARVGDLRPPRRTASKAATPARGPSMKPLSDSSARQQRLHLTTQRRVVPGAQLQGSPRAPSGGGARPRQTAPGGVASGLPPSRPSSVLTLPPIGVSESAAVPFGRGHGAIIL